MKSTKRFLIIFIIITIMLTGCDLLKSETKIIHGDITDMIGDEDEPIEIRSPLSGLPMNEEDIDRRPIAVMYDNHNRARWQAGLKDAEIIYEFRVEAPYTRYMALFLRNEPESIGPVRSARPYFINKALEHDAIYVHVGGSVQAKEDIARFGLSNLDGLNDTGNIFKRRSHKRAPNNLYTSMEGILKEVRMRGYRDITEKDYFKFFDEDRDLNGYDAKNIRIDYRRGNTTSYEYDPDNRLYNRYKDGALHLDEMDESIIQAKNIIVQEVRTDIIDGESRLAIELSGAGNGVYISNGKAQNISWGRDSRGDRTKYLDESGREIRLNPGVTWVQMVDMNSPKIEID